MTPAELKKDEARTRISDAVIALMAEGAEDLSHDAVAVRAGLSRRTVYRYFPDRQLLLQSVWSRVTTLAGPGVTFPASEADLLDSLEAIYTGFDRIAPVATVVRSTPQGRAVRLSQKARRVASYRAAAADAVAALPAEDQRLATAILQVLHTSPWLELHDQWDMTGQDMARGVGWAIRTLLKDLRARNGRPLDEA